MEFSIRPLEGINTIIEAIPSRKLTVRSIIIASLARGTTKITNPFLNNDIMYLVGALQKVGVIIEKKDSILISGVDGQIRNPKSNIYIGDSLVANKYLPPISSLCNDGYITITGDAYPEKRLTNNYNSYRLLGIDILELNPWADLPIKVKAGTFIGGNIEINAEESNDNLSPLLLTAPYAKNEVIIKPISASPTYDLIISLGLMKHFNIDIVYEEGHEIIIKPDSYIANDIVIEGDYTFSSYFFAAAAIHGGFIEIGNLTRNSLQRDRFFLDCLTEMGCKVNYKENSVELTGPRQLRNIVVDMRNNPDLISILAVVCSFADGVSELTNISYLTFSDQLKYLSDELIRMGIRCIITDDSIVIEGGKPHGTKVNLHDDYKLAMAFSIAGLKIPGVVIPKPDLVNDIYPDYWRMFKKV